MVEAITFVAAAAIVLCGALGVILLRNPVHNALSLVATLFGVAVLFIAQEAYFLAAIQVIVYAGAIVVLFLFVIMLLGVDKVERLGEHSLGRHRLVAAVAGGGLVTLVLVAVLAGSVTVTGARSSALALDEGATDVERIARLLFTDYVWAFEITAALLTIAVVGAVLLARRQVGPSLDADEYAEFSAASWIVASDPEPVDEHTAGGQP